MFFIYFMYWLFSYACMQWIFSRFRHKNECFYLVYRDIKNQQIYNILVSFRIDSSSHMNNHYITILFIIIALWVYLSIVDLLSDENIIKIKNFFKKSGTEEMCMAKGTVKLIESKQSFAAVTVTFLSSVMQAFSVLDLTNIIIDDDLK